MSEPAIPRQSMEVDIACAGFGPAAGGFLTTLSRGLAAAGGAQIESKAMPGMPLQVVCYERADDIGFGVSGVVTRARAIRQSFPDLNPAEIPMAAEVAEEKVLYLLDPAGASRRPFSLRLADRLIRLFRLALPLEHDALELSYTPEFLHKQDGLVLSIGQFNQWVAQQLMMSGAVQIWPSSPVAEPLFDDDSVAGIRLMDQGVERDGKPGAARRERGCTELRLEGEEQVVADEPAEADPERPHLVLRDGARGEGGTGGEQGWRQRQDRQPGPSEPPVEREAQAPGKRGEDQQQRRHAEHLQQQVGDARADEAGRVGDRRRRDLVEGRVGGGKAPQGECQEQAQREQRDAGEATGEAREDGNDGGAPEAWLDVPLRLLAT